MSNLKIVKWLMAALILVVGLAGCIKDPDTPPKKTIPEGNILTVAELRNMYKGSTVRFTSKDSLSVYAVVGMAEETGNLYRSAFVQDPTGGIQLRLQNTGGLYEGDSIRIYLPGTKLNSYNGLMQLDSVSVDNNIVKQATNQDVTPKVITISEVGEAYESQIIKLKKVQFKQEELGKTYADAVNQESRNRTLIDCKDNTAIVRTSGYASFADDTLPRGKGSLVAAVGQFRSTYQLQIRRKSEVKFNNPRCGEGPCNPVDTVNEDFSSTSAGNYIDLNCWTNKAIQGSDTRRWIAESPGSNKYAKAAAGNDTNEVWLVTPPVSAGGSDQLTFRTKVSDYSHDGLTVWISTDFDGSNVTGASWQKVNSATIASSNSWTNSGSITVSNYGVSSGDTYYVGFRYHGSKNTNYDSQFMLDDVQITQ